jgi:putative glutathione S-transferase
MGMIVDGRWTEKPPSEFGSDGSFHRIPSAFRNRVTRDGSSGFRAAAGRYHLYPGYHCPWAHRTIIFRVLKGLEHAIRISAFPIVCPYLFETGWTFERRPEVPDATLDQINGFRYLHQAYTTANPHYTGMVTTPVLWDKERRTIVNNESSEIIRMLNSEFAGIANNDTDYYPAQLRAEIDAVNEFVYLNINNGVYRCGFA